MACHVLFPPLFSYSFSLSSRLWGGVPVVVGARKKPRTERRGTVTSLERQGNDGLVQAVVMEAVIIQKSLARKRHCRRSERCDGEPDAWKRARPVRWRGKIPSLQGDVLIPLSFK